MLRPTLASAIVTVALLVTSAGCSSGTGTSLSAPTAPPTAPATATDVVRDLESAAQEIDKAIAAAQNGDLDTARQEYHEFDEDWEKVEDGVRGKSRDAYKAIEQAMDEVQAVLLKTSTPDKEASVAALRSLRQVIDAQKPALK